MALFGRRRDKRDAGQEQDHDGYDEAGGFEPEVGPFDDEEAPEDGFPRLDLGSVRLPVPEGAQLQVEMEDAGQVKAIHVVMPSGQMTVNAYAAPRSGGLWEEVCGELAEQLKADGASVRSAAGEWGQELMASLGELSLRFIGVDGPRWMLRAVVAGPPDQAAQAAHSLRSMVRNTVVVRGPQPMPVRTPLPIELPPEIAAHIDAQGG